MRRYLCALTIVLSAASSARAATIQLTTEVNLSSCAQGGVFCSVFTPIPTQVVAIGDLIDYTVTFAQNQRLVLTDVTGTSAFLMPALGAPGFPGAFAVASAVATLTDLNGGLAQPLVLAFQSGGDAHLGPTFTGFVPVGGSVSFSGYHVQYTVANLPAPLDTYSANLFMAGGSSIAVVTAETPEPATLSLLGLGLLAGGGKLRARLRERRAGNV